MYIIKAYWAGNKLSESSVRSKVLVEEAVQHLQDELDKGMIRHVSVGVTFIPTTVCVDVLWEEELHQMINLSTRGRST